VRNVLTCGALIGESLTCVVVIGESLTCVALIGESEGIGETHLLLELVIMSFI